MIRKARAAALVLVLGTTGCGSAATQPAETLTVYAAASLRTTFTELGGEFEDSHPGTRVTFSFSGSADLLTQLSGGAPADLFAAADEATMDRAVRLALTAGTPVPFASNHLEIAVPRGNPAKVSSLSDLTAADLTLVVCAPQVPCGAATRRVTDAAGVHLKPVSEESSVTDVLNKVATGEADAGLVYATDVRRADGAVAGVAFPEAKGARNRYAIARLAESGSAALATQFLELVRGQDGQRVLREAGFEAP